MDEQTLEQLNRRIDEHQAYLRERLDDLMGAVRAVHEVLLARLKTHEEYHARNEHRWGARKMIERYPFRAMTMVLLAVAALVTAKPDSTHWLGELARCLVQIFK